jgi:hypothetical protein
MPLLSIMSITKSLGWMSGNWFKISSGICIYIKDPMNFVFSGVNQFRRSIMS